MTDSSEDSPNARLTTTPDFLLFGGVFSPAQMITGSHRAVCVRVLALMSKSEMQPPTYRALQLQSVAIKTLNEV